MKFRRVLIPVALAVLATMSVSPSSAATKSTKAKKSKPRTSSTIAVRPASTSPAATIATTAVATTAAPTTTIAPVTGSINVFAAASLTASFTDLAAAFQKANPGATVNVNFGGSPTLVAQIQNGAPADVFASADTGNMDKLVNGNFVEQTPVIFTRNRPMIVVPRGNPLRIKTLADLGRPEVFVALGAVGVPVGDYSRQILAKAGVEVRPKTLEASVSAIVNKAALREIDAGIVYVTDVAIDDYRVDGVAIPDDQNVIATYPIALLANSRNKATAASFVAFVQSPAAQSVFAKYKFLPVK